MSDLTSHTSFDFPGFVAVCPMYVLSLCADKHIPSFKEVQALISKNQKLKIRSWKSQSEYVSRLVTYICYQQIKLCLELCKKRASYDTPPHTPLHYTCVRATALNVSQSSLICSPCLSSAESTGLV